MSAEYSIDALTDEERRLMETIEADLDREMAVEPSADFAARVRARISEPEHRGSSVPWTFAAAAVVVIGTGILLASLRSPPAGMDSPAIVTGHDLALPAANMPPPIVAVSRPPDAGSASIRPAEAPKASFGSRIPRPGSRIDRAVEPDVLVPNDLRLAVARVMHMVRSGTLKEQAFPPERTAATGEESAEPLAAMVVEELQVPPINPAGGGVEKGFGLD